MSHSSRGGTAPTVVVLRAALLCNPVQETLNDEVTTIDLVSRAPEVFGWLYDRAKPGSHVARAIMRRR